jgi:hypothetical protein
MIRPESAASTPNVEQSEGGPAPNTPSRASEPQTASPLESISLCYPEISKSAGTCQRSNSPANVPS